jgi:hypothetical protein
MNGARRRAETPGRQAVRRAIIVAFGAALCAAPIALSAPLSATTQTKASAYKPPRDAYGHPDLSGYWSNATLTPETRPAALGDRAAYTPEEVRKLESAVVKEVEEGNTPTDPNAPAPKVGGDAPAPNTRPEFVAAGGDVGGYNRGWLDPGSTVMRVDGQPRTSLITTPNGQVPPRKAGAPGGGGYPRGMGSFDSYETRSLGERCLLGFGRNAGPPMFSNGFYNNNYQFIQTKDAVVIEVEMVHDLRIVPLNAAHRTDGVRPWMGDSIGRWDGDTLVVETTNIPQAQAYKGSWKNLTVTERFTRVAKDAIRYQFTVDDPTMWDKPWGGEYEFAPLHGIIYEYACHEGNYALPGMLAGARAQEREAAKGGAAGSAP